MLATLLAQIHDTPKDSGGDQPRRRCRIEKPGNRRGGPGVLRAMRTGSRRERICAYVAEHEGCTIIDVFNWLDEKDLSRDNLSDVLRELKAEGRIVVIGMDGRRQKLGRGCL